MCNAGHLYRTLVLLPAALFLHHGMAQTEVEPNDAQGQSTVFVGSGTIQGQSCAGDVDWFSTTVAGEGTLVATLSAENTGGTTGTVSLEVVRDNIFAPNAGQATQVLAPGASANVSVDSYCASAGTYFFRVVSTGSCTFYTLGVSMQSAITANESEPNDSHTTANVLAEGDTARGRVRHLNAGVDNEDWWAITLADFGTLEVYWEVTNTGDATAYYALSTSVDGSLSGANTYPLSVPAGATMAQTYVFPCIHTASNWLRVGGADGCGDYKLAYRIVSDPFTPTEVEPNDSYSTAGQLAPGDTVRGHINYLSLTGSNALDPADFHQLTVTDHGAIAGWLSATNTSPDPGSVTVQMYWGDGSAVWTYNATVAVPGHAQAATPFQFECLAPGTYFMRVTATQCATYALTWNGSGTPIPNAETEPNDAFAQAQPVPYGQWQEGHVGERLYAGVTDINDWFRIDLPEDSVRVRIQYEATGLSTTAGGYLSAAAHRPDQTLAGQVFIGTTFNATTVDSLLLDCFQAGTVYLKLTGNGCQAYRFRVLVEPRVPSVAFTTARFGQQVSFSPQVNGANSLSWDFGDLTSSTDQYPMKTYGFGNFTAVLTATNTTCNYAASASELLVFTGLETYAPRHAGQGPVTMQVYGGSLTNATQVRITGAGGTFTGTTGHANLANSVVSALFDLSTAPLGVYDVEVDIPGHGTVTVQDGFTVEGLVYPECRVDVTGPTQFLINRPQLFRLTVSNPGNVTAEGVVVGMAWPAGLVTVLGSQQLAPSTAGTTTITVDGQTYTINNSDLAAFHAVDPVTPITQLNGEPFIGSVRSFILPQVPAGGVVEIPFTVTGTVAGPVRIMGYAHPLNVYHMGQLAPPWQNMIECFAYGLAEAVDVRDGTRDVPENERQRAAEIAAQHARDAAGRYDEQVYQAQNEVGYTQAGEAASYAEDFVGMLESASRAGASLAGPGLQQQLNDIPGNEQGQLSKGRADAIQQIINENGEVHQQRVFPPGSPWFGNESFGQDTKARLDGLFGPQQDLLTQQELKDKTDAELENAPVELPIEMEDGLVKRIVLTLYRMATAPLRLLSGAFDPNAIYGPAGAGAERFVRSSDQQSFTILFENVDTATAAAQEVFVETQLDLSRFDASTFTFGSVIIGGQYFNVPPGRQEFTMEAQLDPGDPYKVRINGTFNAATGLARWEFITLDLLSNNLPLLHGFLPPNVASPEGEGSVFYTVRPLQTLPSNTTIESTASIVFDLNEAISTNTWSNTTDDVAPTSFASASAQVETITVELNGTDDASGIAYYEIFVSTDGGDWQLLAASTQATAQLTGQVGSTYAFYCQAVDSVGNREVKSPIAETSVLLTGVPDQMAEPLFFSSHPNPTDGVVTITALRPLHGARLELIDARGRVVMERMLSLEAGAGRTIDLSALEAGTYTIRVRSAGGAYGATRIVAVR